MQQHRLEHPGYGETTVISVSAKSTSGIIWCFWETHRLGSLSLWDPWADNYLTRHYFSSGLSWLPSYSACVVWAHGRQQFEWSRVRSSNTLSQRSEPDVNPSAVNFYVRWCGSSISTSHLNRMLHFDGAWQLLVEDCLLLYSAHDAICICLRRRLSFLLNVATSNVPCLTRSICQPCSFLIRNEIGDCMDYSIYSIR